MKAMPAFASARDVARDLRKRSYSAVEAARATIDRLAGLGMELHAVAEITEERALREARAADRRLRRGDAGPLCGVPYGAKDLLAAAGSPTRWGTPFYRNQVFDRDATVIRRLADAGAVLVAKLAMVELAGGGGYRDPAASITGATQNPWDRGHWSGGSSSGSGAAVAAGIVPFALGSETTGSVVIPASFCGITGVRPSLGFVSRHGVMPLSWSLDKIGPLAHTAADCEDVLQATAGIDHEDPATVDVPYRRTSRSSFRLGILPFDEARYPEVRRAFTLALSIFRRLGMRVAAVRVPVHDYRAIAATLLAGESAAAHASLIGGPGLQELLDEAQRRNLARNATLPAADYVRAIERRALAVRDLRALFRDIDAFVTPTVVTEAVKIDSDLDEWRRHYHYGSMAAVAALPGVSVPMGFGSHGLPLGLTIIADQYRDAVALRLARLFQRDTEWHLRRPFSNELKGAHP
jgi:aspartyl-tRNA(Asn)/glutamyl-tRNA(Gln) amidotransferase subunit A